jgi:hypothetical protein
MSIKDSDDDEALLKLKTIYADNFDLDSESWTQQLREVANIRAFHFEDL